MAQTAIVTGGSNGILQAESLAGPETLIGPLLLANQSTTPAAVAGDAQLYASAGQPFWINPQGLTGSIVGSQGGLTAAGTAIANTTAESVIQTMTLPAADAFAGTVYRMAGWGVYSDTGTPTLAWASRWGGVAGTSLSTIAATTLGSGVSNQAFKITCLLNFLSTTTAQVHMELQLGTSTSTNATTLLTSTPSTASTVSVTAAKTWVTTITWSAASASNTIQLLGGISERVA